jgi:protoheme IX farnesyltransferase
MLDVFVNLLAACLTLAAIAFYVVVYTLLLKRTTPLNIVIGGAAGAMPPVVGWAAVTGTVEAPALVLFAIVVLWTPPHFWALALNYNSDYSGPASRCCLSSSAPRRPGARSCSTRSPWWPSP